MRDRSGSRRTRRIALAAAIPVGVLAIALSAVAFWTTSGSGASGFAVGTLESPSVEASSPVTGSARVDWTAVSAPDGVSDDDVRFTVDRSADGGSNWAPVCGTGSLPKPYDVLSCEDEPGAAADYTYRVTAHFRTWTSEGEDTVHVEVDTIPPHVVAVERADASPTGASSVRWTITFSEDVTGVDAGDFTLVGTGALGAALAGVDGAGTSYTVTASTGADGSLGLDLVDDDSIVDPAGNPLGPDDGSSEGESYVVDRTAPLVASVTRDDSDPTNAGAVAWTVAFGEDVSGVDPTDFALVAAGLDGTPAVESVTPIDGRRYTVLATTGDGTPSGSGTLRVDVVDDDSIADAAGNPLGGPGGGNGGYGSGEPYTVDKTQPTPVSILRADPSPTRSGPLHFTVTFSEAVSGVTTSSFSLATANLSGAAPTVTSAVPVGGGTSWTVTVSTVGSIGANDGAIRLDLTSTAAVLDAATNGLAATHIGDESYDFDTTAPTVVAILRKAGAASPTNHGPLAFTVTFSEPVTGLAAVDFAPAGTDITGVPVVAAPVAQGGAPSATWTLALDMAGVTGTDAASVRLDLMGAGSIQDAATNPLASPRAGDEAFAYDTAAPTVTSIDRVGAGPTNAGSVSWTVAFSEPVSGVDAGDFALSQSGVSGAAITGVSGSGPYTVTATTGTGDGTLALGLADDDSIHDAATNALGGAGAGNGSFAGGAFTLDRTPPTVSVARLAGQATPAKDLPIRFTVTFSESVTGFAANDLSRVGTSAGGVVALTGSGGSYEIAVTGAPTNGTLGFAIAAGGASDAAGNPNVASSGPDDLVVYDTVAPTVTVEQAAGQADPTSASPIAFSVSFGEPVTGFVAGDVVLGGTAGATTAVVTGGPTTYTVSVSGMTGAGTVVVSLPAGAAADAAGNASAASTSTDATVTFTVAAPFAGLRWVGPVLTGSGTLSCDDSATAAVTCTATDVGNKGSFTAGIGLRNASGGSVTNSTGASLAVSTSVSGEIQADATGPTGSMTIAPGASATPGTFTLALKPGNSTATVIASVTYGGVTYTISCVVTR
jgi:hypothetical protein